MVQPGSIPSITVTAAYDRLAPDSAEVVAEGAGQRSLAMLVDVREPNEFVQIRADGAVLLPISTFMQRHLEIPRDRSILVICQTGNRSRQVTAFLLANGWADVANVTGGTLAWASAGLPVRRGPLELGEGDIPG
jgi:rhodanese-related sulfurtransferase